MGNFDSIKLFLRRAADLQRRDVVVENAGIAMYKNTEREEMDSKIAVNVVGTFLLALNLLPILRKSGNKYQIPPRPVITISEVPFSVHRT
jgi:retinol dehydrogenase-12